MGKLMGVWEKIELEFFKNIKEQQKRIRYLDRIIFKKEKELETVLRKIKDAKR